MYITSKLDVCANGVSWEIQRYAQSLSKHFAYSFNIHGGSINITNRIGGKEFDNRDYKNKKMSSESEVENEKFVIQPDKRSRQRLF